MKNNFLVYFFVLVAALFFAPKEYEAAILFAMTAVLTYGFVNLKTRNRKKYMIVAIVNLFSIAITLLFHPGLGSGLLLVDIILAIFVFNNITITSKEYVSLHLFMGALLIYYLSIFDFESVTTGLILGASGNMSLNANGLGIITLAIFLHFSCIIPYFKRRLFRIVLFIMMVIGAGSLILLSGSRLALFSLSAFVLVSLLLKKEVSIQVNKRCIRLVLIAGLILPFVYIYLFDIYRDQELLGKNFFSGRQYIWMDAIKAIRNSPILGSGTSVLMYDGTTGYTDNTHNMMLGILKMFGVIPALTIIKYMFCDADINLPNTYRNKTALWAFTCCILVCLGEAFLTDLHLCFIFMSFLLCRIKCTNKDKNRNLITI